MINSRLFDRYGIDTKKNLQMKSYCPRPFDTLLIDQQGACFLCECTSWLPQSVGNIQIQSIDEILVTRQAQELQHSIMDGSYRYCNTAQCSYLQVKSAQDKVFRREVPVGSLRYIRIAIDNSCNLRCPSCRHDAIMIKDTRTIRNKKRWCDRIIDYIREASQPLQVHIGSDGDPFASLVYRYFITHAPTRPSVTYSVQTNGLLLKKMFYRFQHIADRLDTVHISCDGATPGTYEGLRLGGRWNQISDNLKFLKTIKQQYGLNTQLHVVVQQENYKELNRFIDMAQHYQFDRIYFNRIQNWNTGLNFDSANVFDPKHPEYQICQNLIQDIMRMRTSLPHKFIEGTAIPY